MNVFDNFDPPYIRDILLGRRLIPHQEVFIISPFLSSEIFSFVSRFSHSLRMFLKNGTNVTLITKPQPLDITIAICKWKPYGLNIFYNKNLHAKIYYFGVNENSPRFNIKYHQSVALVGSANFTKSGTGMEFSNQPLEEVCVLLKDEGLLLLKKRIDKIRKNSIDSNLGSFILKKCLTKVRTKNDEQ